MEYLFSKVLCSKCKGICNENSENVSRKRKFSDKVEVSPPPAQPVKRGINAPVTRSTNVLAAVRKPPRDRGGGGQQQQQSTITPSLVPYLTRLSDAVPPQADATDGSTMGKSFPLLLENPIFRMDNWIATFELCSGSAANCPRTVLSMRITNPVFGFYSNCLRTVNPVFWFISDSSGLVREPSEISTCLGARIGFGSF
nr:unnamed protein product [Callosobruchus chinensis]